MDEALGRPGAYQGMRKKGRDADMEFPGLGESGFKTARFSLPIQLPRTARRRGLGAAGAGRDRRFHPLSSASLAWLNITTHLYQQPGSRRFPVAGHGAFGDIEGGGDFGNGEPDEVA